MKITHHPNIAPCNTIKNKTPLNNGDIKAYQTNTDQKYQKNLGKLQQLSQISQNKSNDTTNTNHITISDIKAKKKTLKTIY